MLMQPGQPRHDDLDRLDDLLVRPWCDREGHCPSVEFQLEGPPPPQSSFAVPIPVARGINASNGHPFEILLFDKQGRLAFLEFVPFVGSLGYIPDIQELTLDW